MSNASNGRELKKDHAGFRVIDPEGGAHEYPDARALEVERGDLYLLGADGKGIGIFHRWEHVERIAATQPSASAVYVSVNVDATTVERMIADADANSHFSRVGR